MRQINPDVVAAYPITPQTSIMEEFSAYVAQGVVDTELVRVESEHSSMSACIGASAAGARVLTATSSQGLALMFEMLYIASSLRLPIVMVNVNRALSAPINIHCDHSDSYGARDSGWIQIYSENAQEAYDNLIQAVRLAEDPKVLLPVMVCLDGFIISHGIDRVELLEDRTVREFVGEYKPAYSLLNVDSPITMGAFALPDFYYEFKRMQAEVMKRVEKVADEVAQEYAKFSRRNYSSVSEYRLDDAEVAIVAMGSVCGTARVVVDEMRKEGKKVGLLKVRLYRPFPSQVIREKLSPLKVVGILDRGDTFSNLGGPLFLDVKSSLFELPKPPLLSNFIYGLGGREVSLRDIRSVYEELFEYLAKGEAREIPIYLGAKE
jgi:pyruvate ferredoxin oxidoreductase alpha subunit